MSATVHTPQFAWALAHRTALVIALLAVAFAAAAGLLVARLVLVATPAHGTSVSTVHPGTIDNCLLLDRPGRPTPC